MRFGIGRILELSGDKGTGNLAVQLLRLRNGSLHSLRPRGEDDLRAIGLQQLAPLHAHGFRQGQNCLVALGRSHSRQADSGISAGGFNDGGSRLQQPLLFSIQNHLQGNPVFYAASRIKILQLRQNHSVCNACCLFVIHQLHKRGSSNEFFRTFFNICHSLFSFFI